MLMSWKIIGGRRDKQYPDVYINLLDEGSDLSLAPNPELVLDPLRTSQ